MDRILRGSGPDSSRIGRLALAGVVLYALLLIVLAGWRARSDASTSDFLCFHRTGIHFLQTGEITPAFGVRNYLPFFTVLMAPFSLLDSATAAALFMAVSLAMYGLAAWMLTRGLLPEHPTGVFHKVAVPMLILLPYLHACAVLGQVTLLVTGLVILGWAMFFDERPVAAGVPLALAILIKPYLLTTLGFFVLGRQWKMAASTLTVCLALGLGLPRLVLSSNEWSTAHANYLRRVVVDGSSFATIAAESSRYDRYNNQSLAAVLKRLTRPISAGHSDEPLRVNVLHLPVSTVQFLYAAGLILLLSSTIWACRRPLARTHPDAWHYQFNLWVLLGLIASPIIWTHYFPLLLHPLALLTVRLMLDGDAGRPNRFGLFVWSLWIVAAFSFALELFVPGWPRAIGLHLWATIALYAALIVAVRRFPPVFAPALLADHSEMRS